MNRRSREDWARLGLDALVEEGPEGLTVARMCARAGCTRGSLYHHFDSQSALVDATMEAWRASCTEALVAATPPGEGALEKLQALSMAIDPTLEQAVRRLVAQTPRLQPFLHDVDSQRVAHSTHLFEQAGLSASDARCRAEVEYAAFLGFQQLALTPDRLGELVRWFNRRMDGQLASG